VRAGWVAALLCGALLLGGCTDDEPDVAAEHPRLLQPDDLPPVEDVTVSEGSSASKTNCGAMDAERQLAITGEDETYLNYLLEDGTRVRSAVQGTSMSSDSIDETFERLDAMIDECVQRNAGTGEFERLEVTEDDAVGFTGITQTSDGPQTTERIYARLDDQHAVVVTVVHVGDEPPVTAEELLPRAMERARG